MSATQTERLPRKWWLTIPALVVLAGIVLSTGSGCGHEQAKANADDAMSVSVVHPTVQTFRRWINQPGIVESYETTPIYSKLQGYLEDVRVDIGDKLKRGELLCKVWVPEIEEAVKLKEAKVEQGKAEVKRAREFLLAAKANVQTCTENVSVAIASVIRANAQEKRWSDELIRDKMLEKDLRPEIIKETAFQWDAAKLAVKQAEANVAASQAALAESKAREHQAEVDVKVADANLGVWQAEDREEKAWFSYARITAPYDGIVTHRYIHTSHFVQPSNSGSTSKASEPLFVVMRTDLMRMVVQVPEYDAPLVKDGAEAIVKLQAYPGENIKCKVEQSSWSLDPEVRTLRVEIFLKNPCPQLRAGQEIQAGMYANASIAADVPNALTVPAEAVLTDGNVKYCYMLEGGKARRVNVHAGTTNDKVTEILGKEGPPKGPSEGINWVKLDGQEQIITSKLKSIQDGQDVKAQ